MVLSGIRAVTAWSLQAAASIIFRCCGVACGPKARTVLGELGAIHSSYMNPCDRIGKEMIDQCKEDDTGRFIASTCEKHSIS